MSHEKKSHRKSITKRSKDMKEFENLFEKIEEFEEIQGYAEDSSPSSPGRRLPYMPMPEMSLKQKLDEARKTSITAMEE